ncbi:MAG: 3'-5' exonuclease [Alphaproteobacteria bacterium]
MSTITTPPISGRCAAASTANVHRAAQLVEVRERVEAGDDTAQDTGGGLFAAVDDETMLAYGVPAEWLGAVRRVGEDGLLDLVGHLPQEASEALLQLATGGTPPPAPAAAVDADPFAHPDAGRRFRLLANVDELARALDYPWARWTTFLHPMQRELVERSYDGPARISGSAGTGKTVVALHRAVFLARRAPAARILLTTFWPSLAADLSTRLDMMTEGEPAVRNRIEAKALGAVVRDLYAAVFGPPSIAPTRTIRDLMAAHAEPGLGLAVLMDEWEGVVDAFQIRDWRTYRDFALGGVHAHAGPKRRKRLWSVFTRVWDALEAEHMVTQGGMFVRLAEHYAAGAPPPWEHIVVDEAQDIGIAELRFLAAAGGRRDDGLFFTGDLGQRIFRQPFSWLALGIDVRGRTHRLSINYRTSHQIRARADRLLPAAMADADGIEEPRAGTVSAFNGPRPTVALCADAEEEIARVGAWLKAVSAQVRPEEIGLFVRTPDQFERARLALAAAGLEATPLTAAARAAGGTVALGPMHLAKGLEFRAVAVMACDEGILPLASRIAALGEDAGIDDVISTERHLLYVACTRARDHLLVTGVAPGSMFLADIGG